MWGCCDRSPDLFVILMGHGLNAFNTNAIYSVFFRSSFEQVQRTAGAFKDFRIRTSEKLYNWKINSSTTFCSKYGGKILIILMKDIRKTTSNEKPNETLFAENYSPCFPGRRLFSATLPLILWCSPLRIRLLRQKSDHTPTWLFLSSFNHPYIF